MFEILGIALLVAVIIAFKRQKDLIARVARLEHAVTRLTETPETVARSPEPPQADREDATFDAATPPESDAQAVYEQSAPDVVAETPAVTSAVEPTVVSGPASSAVPPSARQEAQGEGTDYGTRRPAATASDGGTLEQKLASRWMVWLGAVTLALGGVFLVKYSIDRGLLGPAVRTSMGVLLGIALVVFGEWLRQRPFSRVIASLDTDYVPPALTAAGVSLCFGSLFAAHALYGLIPLWLAFFAMAVVALGAIALSLLQGRFVAVLGIVGGYVLPALLASPEPNAWALFTYLFVVTAAAVTVVRYKRWWPLAWLTVFGAAVWPVLWMYSAWVVTDAVAVGLHLLVTTALFFAAGYGFSDTDQGDRPLFRMTPDDDGGRVDMVATGAAFVLALVAYMYVHRAHFDTAAVVFIVALCLVDLAAGFWRGRLVAVAYGALILAALVLLSWSIAPDIIQTRPWIVLHGVSYWSGDEPLLPAELVPFAVTGAVLAAAFAFIGFAGVWLTHRPAMWAVLSASAPVVFLIIAYWRIDQFATSVRWAGAALVLALVFVAMPRRVVTSPQFARLGDGVLAAYIMATLAASSLAASMALEEAWLTVALSVQVPALTWLFGRMKLPQLVTATWIVAAVVLARLLANPYVLDYAMGTAPGINWLLYGYGIPAVAFYWSARRYAAFDQADIATVLEAGALAFFVVLVSLEINHAVSGGAIGYHSAGLVEKSLHTLSWGIISLGLFIVHRRTGRIVHYWGARVLGAGALLHALVFHGFVSNPLWTGEPVGTLVLLDKLLLAYALPGVLAAVYAWIAAGRDAQLIARIAGVAALVLFFAFVSLEVRHLFHGTNLATGRTGDAEWYVYSLAWLIYAGVLLALAMWLRATPLRYASLALVLLTVAKVFLLDMSNLTGLYRVASFFGLGGSLIAVGYLYQRYVFPPARKSAQTEES